MNNEPLFTVGYVAKHRLLGVSSANTIFKMMDRGEIKWVDIAEDGCPTRKPRIPQSAIDEYLKNRMKVHENGASKPKKKVGKKSAAAVK